LFPLPDWSAHAATFEPTPGVMPAAAFSQTLSPVLGGDGMKTDFVIGAVTMIFAFR
jgi:hypothetical protein